LQCPPLRSGGPSPQTLATMNRLFAALLSMLALGVCASAEAEILTLCNSMSEAVFNCHIQNSGKIISLCAPKSSFSEEKYLQYIFGSPGKIELIFPKNNLESSGQFSYQKIYNRNFGHLFYGIDFSIKQSNYSIFWELTSELDEKTQSWNNIQITSGVSVTKNKDEFLGALKCDSKKKIYEDFESVDSLFNVTHK
jgi:hypothetical protein